MPVGEWKYSHQYVAKGNLVAWSIFCPKTNRRQSTANCNGRKTACRRLLWQLISRSLYLWVFRFAFSRQHLEHSPSLRAFFSLTQPALVVLASRKLFRADVGLRNHSHTTVYRKPSPTMKERLLHTKKVENIKIPFTSALQTYNRAALE